jgi:hypothetical protein
VNLVKKNLVLIIVALIVALAGTIYVLAGDDRSNDGGPHGSTDYAAVDACDLLKLDEAQLILGSAATASANTGSTKSNDVNVSTCSYTNNATAVADIKVATIMVRSALSKDGANSNKAVFGTGRPDGAEKVEDFGDEAYFMPKIGQLNILDGNNWLIVSYGSTSPSSRTLDNAKAVAHLALDHDGASHDQMTKH